MQRYLGHPIKTGGRPPVDREKLRVAAKLSHWSAYNRAMIAEFFGWPASPASEKRAAEYVAKGTALLAQEMGDDWTTKVPRGHAARAKLLHRQQHALAAEGEIGTG